MSDISTGNELWATHARRLADDEEPGAHEVALTGESLTDPPFSLGRTAFLAEEVSTPVVATYGDGARGADGQDLSGLPISEDRIAEE